MCAFTTTQLIHNGIKNDSLLQKRNVKKKKSTEANSTSLLSKNKKRAIDSLPYTTMSRARINSVCCCFGPSQKHLKTGEKEANSCSY